MVEIHRPVDSGLDDPELEHYLQWEALAAGILANPFTRNIHFHLRDLAGECLRLCS